MDIAMSSQWNHDPTNLAANNDYEKDFESYISDVDDDGFDGGHEYSQLFQPEQHNDPPEEHQQLNEIFIEIPQPNIRLDLCPVCSRKFAPESLLKHVIICEKVSTSRRTPFDSSKQRMNGPEYTTVAVTAQSPLTERRLTPSRVSPPKTLQRKLSETSLKSTPAASTERMLTRKNSTISLASTGTTRMVTRSLSQTSDKCPHCGRTFGYRAYDRHVEWCKEKTLIRPSPDVATISAARERMKTRINYKAPNLKTKRGVTRDKYSSTSCNGSQNSLADFDSLLHSMSSSMTSEHGLYDPFLSAKKQLEDLFSPTANPEKTSESETATTPTPTTNMINSMMATPISSNEKKISNNNNNDTNNIMSKSLTSQSSFTPKTPQPLPRSQGNFKRTSSLRLSNRSRTKWTPPPQKSPHIHCGIDDDGPVSPSFVKATDYDEIPVGSPMSVIKMYEGKIPTKIVPTTKITAMPVIINTNNPPVMRDKNNLLARKNLKLDIKNPNLPQTNLPLSKTDSLAMFLKYEKELTAKELKDKSNCLSKQNLTKDNKLPDINANSNEKKNEKNDEKSHSAPMKLINACDNLPSLQTKIMSDSDKSRSPSIDRKLSDENDSSPCSTSKRSAKKRQMKYNMENILYDTDPEVKSNRSSSDNSNQNSLERPSSRLSHTESIFEDFDFDQFIASFNDDDKFPIFKDYKIMMNNTTKSSAEDEVRKLTKLTQNSMPLTQTQNINNNNNNNCNVVKNLHDSQPIPIQSPTIRKLPEQEEMMSGFEKLDNLCKMLSGNSDSDESNSLEAEQTRSKSSTDSAYGSYVSRQSQSPFDQRKTPHSTFKPTPPIRQHLEMKTTEIVMNPVAAPTFQETIMIPRNGNTQLSRSLSTENDNNNNFYSRFCHECGYKFVVPTAKFCIECGVRRVKI